MKKQNGKKYENSGVIWSMELFGKSDELGRIRSTSMWVWYDSNQRLAWLEEKKIKNKRK